MFSQPPPASIIIPGKLYLGNLRDAHDPVFLEKNRVTDVINMCSERDARVADTTDHWFPILDGLGNTVDQLKVAVERLKELQDAGKVVLVHCRAGVSRSATVVATWFAQETGMSFDEASDIVRKLRPVANPHYALRKLARTYLGEISEDQPY